VLFFQFDFRLTNTGARASPYDDDCG
jgi:hypothetical protein